jgi:hypothetical protein
VPSLNAAATNGARSDMVDYDCRVAFLLGE